MCVLDRYRWASATPVVRCTDYCLPIIILDIQSKLSLPVNKLSRACVLFLRRKASYHQHAVGTRLRVSNNNMANNTCYLKRRLISHENGPACQVEILPEILYVYEAHLVTTGHKISAYRYAVQICERM